MSRQDVLKDRALFWVVALMTSRGLPLFGRQGENDDEIYYEAASPSFLS